MTMKFKSKVVWWFYLVALFSLLGPMIPIYLGVAFDLLSALVIGIIAMIAVATIVFSITFGTYYVLEMSAIHIRCGLCINKRIAYNEITDIRETNNPEASAALSLDRIEILYSGNKKIYISPVNKQEFLRQFTTLLR